MERGQGDESEQRGQMIRKQDGWDAEGRPDPPCPSPFSPFSLVFLPPPPGVFLLLFPLPSFSKQKSNALDSIRWDLNLSSQWHNQYVTPHSHSKLAHSTTNHTYSPKAHPTPTPTISSEGHIPRRTLR